MPAKPATGQKSRPTVRPPLPEAHADVALCDIQDCMALSRFGESWIHEAVKDGRFPQPVIREHRCTRWRLAEVRAWLVERAGQPLGAGATTNDARARRASAQAQANRAQREATV